MRLFYILALPLLLLQNCQPNKEIEPVELSGCSDDKYTRAKQLTDVATRVITKTYTRTDGSTFTDYYLYQPDVAGFTIPWAPCNLPDAYKKDLLPVRISGYTLTYPGMERENRIGSPIELSHIEVGQQTR